MNGFKDWFLHQSPRDQIVMSLGGIAVILYILFFLVLMPMRNHLHKMENRNTSALAEQERVRELAGRLLASREQAQTSGANAADQGLNGIINNSLNEFELRMENFQPSGSSARIRLAPADFNKVLSWVADIEGRQGLQIKDLTMTADVTVGSVLTSVTVARGGE